MTGIVEWAVNNTAPDPGADRRRDRRRRIAFIAIPKEADPDIPIPLIVRAGPLSRHQPGRQRTAARQAAGNVSALDRRPEDDHAARAYQGGGSIILEFDVNFNKQKALEDVRAQVDATRAATAAGRRPADRPGSSTPASYPVITVALSGDVPERTLLNIARDLRDEIKTDPERAAGAISRGASEELLEIVIDPAKLESYGITQNEMFNAITQQQHG